MPQVEGSVWWAAARCDVAAERDRGPLGQREGCEGKRRDAIRLAFGRIRWRFGVRGDRIARAAALAATPPRALDTLNDPEEAILRCNGGSIQAKRRLRLAAATGGRPGDAAAALAEHRCGTGLPRRGRCLARHAYHPKDRQAD